MFKLYDNLILYLYSLILYHAIFTSYHPTHSNKTMISLYAHYNLYSNYIYVYDQNHNLKAMA